MKKIMLIVAIAIMMCSCTKENDNVNPVNDNKSVVTLNFTPYEMSPMKTVYPIGDYTTHLDVYIQDITDPTAPLIRLHQTNASTSNPTAGYGTVQVNMNAAHNYTLFAVAHRGTDTASLIGNTIIFPSNEEITHSFFYTQTFNPEYNTNINCNMKRIVGEIQFIIQDSVPAAITKFQFIIDSTYTRWNINNYPENNISKIRNFTNFSRTTSGGAGFTMFVMSESDTTTTFVNLTVTALTANDSIFYRRVLTDIPVKSGYQTRCTGTFFRNFNMGSTFTTSGWNARTYNY